MSGIQNLKRSHNGGDPQSTSDPVAKKRRPDYSDKERLAAESLRALARMSLAAESLIVLAQGNIQNKIKTPQKKHILQTQYKKNRLQYIKERI